jgi:hypothetical protein
MLDSRLYTRKHVTVVIRPSAGVPGSESDVPDAAVPGYSTAMEFKPDHFEVAVCDQLFRELLCKAAFPGLEKFQDQDDVLETVVRVYVAGLASRTVYGLAQAPRDLAVGNAGAPVIKPTWSPSGA